MQISKAMKRSVHLEGTEEGQSREVRPTLVLESPRAEQELQDSPGEQMLTARAADPARFLHGSVPRLGSSCGRTDPEGEVASPPLLLPVKMTRGGCWKSGFE